tara:strand:+ start:1914 stop:2228 length:315 start_codon:yes stop_codon:yes gene_type:complete
MIEDPQPLDMSTTPAPAKKVVRKSNPFKEARLYSPRGKNTLYSRDKTALTYKDKSMLTSNPQSDLTRVKPLVPNLLDKALIDSVNMAAAKKRASGQKWVIVREK